jgi:hypothetical protein
MTIDWKSVYEAARRANLAYLIDPAQSQISFEDIGLHWLGIFQNGSHQAVACIDDQGQGYLSIAGTRFGQRIGDLIDDIFILPHDLGDGVHVTKGAFEGVSDMWDWANSLVDASTVWNVEGHSLGAWRTRYTPVFLPESRIGQLHSFESPKGANRAYWEKYQKILASMVSVVNDQDIFVGYPLGLTEWEHPQMLAMQWLAGPAIFEIYPNQWVNGFSLPDHSIDVIETKCKILAGL